MKKLLFLLIAIFCGCATVKPAYHSKMPAGSVYIDPYNAWVNGCPRNVGGRCDSWKTIYVRVINKKYRDVVVTIKCFERLGDAEREVASKTKTVEKRSDKRFVLWGLFGDYFDIDGFCKITKIK